MVFVELMSRTATEQTAAAVQYYAGVVSAVFAEEPAPPIPEIPVLNGI